MTIEWLLALALGQTAVVAFCRNSPNNVNILGRLVDGFCYTKKGTNMATKSITNPVVVADAGQLLRAINKSKRQQRRKRWRLRLRQWWGWLGKRA